MSTTVCKLLLTVQAERDVDGAVVTDRLQVLDAGTLKLGGSGRIAHIYPANSLLRIDEVHSHGLFGGDGRNPGRGATQGGASDVVKVGDQQNRQTVHRLWVRLTNF